MGSFQRIMKMIRSFNFCIHLQIVLFIFLSINKFCIKLSILIEMRNSEMKGTSDSKPFLTIGTITHGILRGNTEC